MHRYLYTFKCYGNTRDLPGPNGLDQRTPRVPPPKAKASASTGTHLGTPGHAEGKLPRRDVDVITPQSGIAYIPQLLTSDLTPYQLNGNKPPVYFYQYTSLLALAQWRQLTGLSNTSGGQGEQLVADVNTT